MCRLFGFRSVLDSQVHRSLLGADNALVRQGEEHPDGWGVAYYQNEVPHVVKTADSAIADSLFERVSGIVASQTVVAHLRRATHGDLSMINSHPFQHGRWVFAHNGGVPNFEQYRGDVESMIDPELGSYILGDTDSEVLFYLLLSNMKRRFDLRQPDPPLEPMVDAAEEMVDTMRSMTGIDCYEPPYDEEDLFLSFVLTDGHTMIAHQGGKPLYYSTHKTRCPERDVCAHFADVCESATDSGPVNHLLLASEPLEGENVWREMTTRQTVGVNADMELSMFRGSERTPTAGEETSVERAAS